MMHELELWRERAAALASGLPWEEYPVVIHNGHVIYGQDAEDAMRTGAIPYCKTCSSPRQPVYHTRMP